MSESVGIIQRWRNYRPSKAGLFWCCILYVCLTMTIGFTWGGWVTGWTAHNMVAAAADEARTDLAASICVSHFMSSKNATEDLAKLKNTPAWQRGEVIEQAGWSTIAGQKEPINGAADVCAQRLVEMQPPSTSAQNSPAAQPPGTQSKTDAVTVQ
jgi:hypothetical protein